MTAAEELGAPHGWRVEVFRVHLHRDVYAVAPDGVVVALGRLHDGLVLTAGAHLSVTVDWTEVAAEAERQRQGARSLTGPAAGR